MMSFSGTFWSSRNHVRYFTKLPTVKQVGICSRLRRRVHRPVGLDPLRICGDLLFGLGDHLLERRVLLLACLELLPLELEQLEALLLHAELQLVGALGRVLEPLLVQL